MNEKYREENGFFNTVTVYTRENQKIIDAGRGQLNEILHLVS